MLSVQILSIICKHLNIIDLSHVVLCNHYIYRGILPIYHHRLLYYNFYIITYNVEQYHQLINNILIAFGDIELMIECHNSEIFVHNLTDMCIKLPSSMFKYYVCLNDIKFRLNLYRLNRIAEDMEMFDKLYIYKELEGNNMYIYVSNKFSDKFKTIYNIHI